jgi:hypothetical protein
MITGNEIVLAKNDESTAPATALPFLGVDWGTSEIPSSCVLRRA